MEYKNSTQGRFMDITWCDLNREEINITYEMWSWFYGSAEYKNEDFEEYTLFISKLSWKCFTIDPNNAMSHNKEEMQPEIAWSPRTCWAASPSNLTDVTLKTNLHA